MTVSLRRRDIPPFIEMLHGRGFDCHDRLLEFALIASLADRVVDPDREAARMQRWLHGLVLDGELEELFQDYRPRAPVATPRRRAALAALAGRLSEVMPRGDLNRTELYLRVLRWALEHRRRRPALTLADYLAGMWRLSCRGEEPGLQRVVLARLSASFPEIFDENRR